MNISVLIPTYMPGDYLWECIDSIYAQTLPKSEFEVVLVLNGCGEPYLSMLHKCIDRYEGMNITILHADTVGVSNARNIALDAAKGDMICFLDDDDRLSGTYLQALYENVEDDIIVCSNVKGFDEKTGVLSDDYISRAFVQLSKVNRPLYSFEGRRFLSSACCKMIPKSLIGDKRFDTKFSLGEDSLFMLSLEPEIRRIKLSPPDCIYFRRLRSHPASRKRRSVADEWANDIRLCCAYTNIWSKHMFTMNFPFFMSRIIATLYKMISCLSFV